ncbi:hypothetical protein CSOJ01_14220 [Colletotrichum sojae]|uniref:Uncharacterized protein n=1 Tax=Colletotrichum sojae TaxID=2175907 RepID=A0A8H6IQC7_9PEZI|nr:hypothetical protein CSOJ01_14220 [Colletotrichum sojae]
MDATGSSIASGTGVPSGVLGVPEMPVVPEPAYDMIPRLSPASDRLKWTLNGPLESAIEVSPNRYYEPGDVMEPYFRADLDPTWHLVSQESLMEPKITTVRVRIGCLEEWEDTWVEINRHCTDTKTDPRRPRAKDFQLELTASGEFLTIHEYVSAVHPWLMGILVVLSFGRAPLRIATEDRWAGWHKKPNTEPVPRLSKAESENYTKQVIERQKARSAARIQIHIFVTGYGRGMASAMPSP